MLIHSVNFPNVKCPFILTDSSGKEFRTPNIPDIFVKHPRYLLKDTTIKTDIFCPDTVYGAFSVIFTLDISKSMGDTIPELGITKIEYQKQLILNAIKLLPSDSTKWEAAITKYDEKTREHQFYTNNKYRLINAIQSDSIYPRRINSDFNSAFCYDTTFPSGNGALWEARRAKYKPIVFFFNDGNHNEQKSLPPDRENIWVNRIIKEAADTSNKPAPVTIYSVSFNIDPSTEILSITKATGGKSAKTDVSIYKSNDSLLTEFFSKAFTKAENENFKYFGSCVLSWTYDCSFRGGIINYFIPKMDSLSFSYNLGDFQTQLYIIPDRTSYPWELQSPQFKDIYLRPNYDDSIIIKSLKFSNSCISVYNWYGEPPPCVITNQRMITIQINCKDSDPDTIICNFFTNACYDKELTIIRTYPKLYLILPESNSVCYGDTLELGLKNYVVGGKVPYKYKWEPPDGLSSDTIANPLIKGIMDRTFTVTVTDSRNVSVKSDLFVRLDSLPNTEITFIKGSVMEQKRSFYCPKYDFNLTSKWEAFNCKLLTPDDKDTVEILWTAKGNARLILTQTDKVFLCKNSDTMNVVVSPLGVEESSGQSENCKSLKIINFNNDYQNKLINIDFTAENENSVNVIIVDILGNIKTSQRNNISEGINYLSISTDGLSKGVYFMLIKSEGCTIGRKVVVL